MTITDRLTNQVIAEAILERAIDGRTCGETREYASAVIDVRSQMGDAFDRRPLIDALDNVRMARPRVREFGWMIEAAIEAIRLTDSSTSDDTRDRISAMLRFWRGDATSADIDMLDRAPLRLRGVRRMNMSRKLAEFMAQELIENCCIEGLRNRGGRYTRISDDAALVRRLADLVLEIYRAGEPKNKTVGS